MGQMQQRAQEIIPRNSDTPANTWGTAHTVVQCCDLQNLTCWASLTVDGKIKMNECDEILNKVKLHNIQK
jgi:hypothetical protein